MDSPEESMRRLFEVDMGEHWAERALYKQIMFASNGPRFRQFKLLRGIEQLNLRDFVKDAIYSQNALRFLYGEES